MKNPIKQQSELTYVLKKLSSVFGITVLLTLSACAPASSGDSKPGGGDVEAIAPRAVVRDVCFDSNRRIPVEEVCRETNRNRARYGLAPLTLDSSMTSVAEEFALDMYKNAYFSHTSPSGQTMASRLSSGHVKWGYAGENIAEGWPDAVNTVQQWMDSPGHRANILEGRFRKIGIGHHDKIWVQNFTD